MATSAGRGGGGGSDNDRGGGGERPYIGVWKRSFGKYSAQIFNANLHRVWLGTFDAAEEAARVYDKAARRFHGPNANTNFSIDRDLLHQELSEKTMVSDDTVENNNTAAAVDSSSSDDDEGDDRDDMPIGLKLSKKARREIIELMARMRRDRGGDDREAAQSDCGSSLTVAAAADVAEGEDDHEMDLELKLGVNAQPNEEEVDLELKLCPPGGITN